MATLPASALGRVFMVCLLVGCAEPDTKSPYDPFEAASSSCGVGDEARLTVDDFNTATDDACTFQDSCSMDGSCQETEGMRSSLAPEDAPGATYCPTRFCSQDGDTRSFTASGCVAYPVQQVGSALELSSNGLLSPEETANPNRAWFGYSIKLDAPGQPFKLPECYDCLSFLVQAEDIADDVDIEVSLKETSALEYPAETYPKCKLSTYALVGSHWCRVHVPVSDLLMQGATGDQKLREIEKDKLAELNISLTTANGAPAGETLHGSLVLDDFAFEACSNALPEGLGACKSP